MKIMSEDERRQGLDVTVGSDEELQYIRRIINDNYWRFAKTYAEFCPHEYTLWKTWKNKVDYNNMVEFIGRNGVRAQYGKTCAKTYWIDHETGYYYFIFDEDIDENGKATKEAYLVNRAKLADFEFWTEDSENGKIVRCRTKKK